MGEVYGCGCSEVDDKNSKTIHAEIVRTMQKRNLKVDLIMNDQVIMSTAGRTMQRILSNIRGMNKNLLIFSYYHLDDDGEYYVRIENVDDLKADWQHWQQYQEGDEGFKLVLRNGEKYHDQYPHREGAELSDFWKGAGGSTKQ